MKKILIGLMLVMTVMMTGCGKENIKLDLAKVDESLLSLTNDEFYLLGVHEIVDKNINEMTSIYDYDLKEKFNLNKDNISDSLVKYNETTKELVMFLKPVELKKEEVKKEVTAYFTNLAKEEKYKDLISKRLEKEYEGYLVYIVTNKNEELFNKVKEAKMPIFGAMMAITGENIETTLGLTSDMYDEFVMEMPMMIVNSNTYIIVKPKSGKSDIVKEKINAYMVKLEEQWKSYLPAQYELVKNRKVEKIGDYLVYVVSSNNNKVVETIKSMKQ
ncbi:MAG: DUF4358 domain-containing protein [Bacilli bacterium]